MSHTALSLLLDFDDQVQRDRDQTPAFLHRRDRRFALDCQQRGIRPDPAQWLAQMHRLSGPGQSRSAGRRALRRWSRVTAGLVATGAALGIVTMLGLLFYDGGQRINVTVILGFVLLHLLLALATTIQAAVGWQPWRWLIRRLGEQPSSAVQARLQPLLMTRAAHAGGCAFATLGLITLLAMVVVQDLAFGWSTTLDTAAGSYHRLVQGTAAPWAWLWPAAAPSLELVEATRFFRAATGAPAIDPARWGQWWPFVTMLWLCWVLIPRALLLAFSQWLLHQRARHLLARHPDWQALMYRMETPTLDTGNQHNDAHHQPDTATRTELVSLPDTDIVLCWAGAGEPEPPQSLVGPQAQVHRAGGRASLDQDEQVLAQIAGALAAARQLSVLVLTRSWEPPTGELQDFLEQAHRAWPVGTAATLVPLSASPGQPPASHLLAPWLRFSERLPAGFVRVALPPTEPRPDYHHGGVPT